MRKVKKSQECPELKRFRKIHPLGTWYDYRCFNSGISYKATKELLFSDQHGICSYCEAMVEMNGGNASRVEHFNSKRGATNENNCHLRWENLLGVCISDNAKRKEGYELPRNLSCDSYKDHIDKERYYWYGEVLFPPEIPDEAQLFDFCKATGQLVPHEENCASVTINPNNFDSTYLLVENSIRVFNLNCYRLCKARLQVLYQFERMVKKVRIDRNRHLMEQLIQSWSGTKQFQTVRDILMPRARIIAEKL